MLGQSPCRLTSRLHGLVLNTRRNKTQFMKRSQTTVTIACQLCLGLAVLLSAHPAIGQVSPAEIPNLKLKAAEQKYLPQLQSLHKAIADSSFPFPFVLTR